MRNKAKSRFASFVVGLTTFTALFIGSSPVLAADDPSRDISRLIAKEPFGRSWPLPEEFTPERLKKLLQLFSDQTFGAAFRVIGDENDFFHGHILWTADELTSQGRMKPVAILYHTQEEAYSAHWGTKRSTRDEVASAEFDYLDVRTRNWLQWLSPDPDLDGIRIENARDYVLAAKKDPNIFFGDNVPVEREHFTIHGRWLDPAKLGVKIIGEMQWEFYKSPCEVGNRRLQPFERGPISVILPVASPNSPECLMLQAKSVFLNIKNIKK